MANLCLPQVQACAIRVAKLDSNGVPHPGAKSLYTSHALVSMTVNGVYTDGDEIEEKGACGTVLINYKGDDTFKRADVEITVATHDPDLMAMLSDTDVIVAGSDPTLFGVQAPAIGPVGGNGVSVELWAKRINNGDLDPDFPYERWALPKIKSLRPGNFTFDSGANMPSFTGQALENINWSDGPVNDWDFTSDRVWQHGPDTTLPDAVCGATTISPS